ncbi:hypothetical protein Snoj_20060 [Streptomyces nojiriensis]|uniref:Uncharacterized protein n=1 Tax=Streptomyces nojiriensis TaxID=66374 RepID=A0ABQ3SIW5_9ACTN|nr:hypothetical protein [Streptomyces nojiriensis]QTI49698.1 hypothetical protein JYK04_07571 [Streptomyces nojiriensis]GGS23641.1 hypothetical protein GCM10010205_61980 [Streptomyces nojiriensis]GHI68088.1 hypothetical protein Snoj_20060 [Streptomyces nojiriensis]
MPVVLPRLIGTGKWFGYGDRVLTPADDAALLRRRQEQWGAELFLAHGACLELAVDRPPLDPRAAGDGMVRSTMWSLWWD